MPSRIPVSGPAAHPVRQSIMRNTRQLWVQGLLAIGLAIVVGVLAPDTAVAFMPLADAFIALLPLMLAPIIVTTVVLGLAHVGDLGHIGHIGLIGHIGHIGHIGRKGGPPSTGRNSF